jgi:hypothetical protein
MGRASRLEVDILDAGLSQRLAEILRAGAGLRRRDEPGKTRITSSMMAGDTATSMSLFTAMCRSRMPPK